jgi:hypothetical protein
MTARYGSMLVGRLSRDRGWHRGTGHGRFAFWREVLARTGPVHVGPGELRGTILQIIVNTAVITSKLASTSTTLVATAKSPSAVPQDFRRAGSAALRSIRCETEQTGGRLPGRLLAPMTG